MIMNQLFDMIPLWITNSCQPIFFDNQPGINFFSKEKTEMTLIACLCGVRGRGFRGKMFTRWLYKSAITGGLNTGRFPSRIFCALCVFLLIEDYQG